MSDLARLESESFAFDFLMLMRRLDRMLGRRPGQDIVPRLGDSATRREEWLRLGADDFLIRLGQDAFLEFPASTVTRVRLERDAIPKRLSILVRFMGFLGPQGALPLWLTEEAFHSELARDESFSRFLDIFNHRFIALFFRAWGDSRPIVHADRPELDRFKDYMGSVIGVGSPAFEGLSDLPAGIHLYAGLLGPQHRGASRLRSAIRGIFGTKVDIEQFVGSWLEFDPEDRSHLGQRNSGLGTDFVLGRASFSVQDKIRIRIYVETMADYHRFLPNGDRCAELADLVFFYIGDELDWEIELALPGDQVEPTRLGAGARLGWTSWLPRSGEMPAYLCDARFNASERALNSRAAPENPQ